MTRLDNMAGQVPAPAASTLPDEKEVAAAREQSALSKISFSDLYKFLWKLTAAMVVFAIPFFIIFLVVANVVANR